ncbi:MAG: hypothetical protein EVJ46_08300 [Candidatus Acididesulfobacter guangdongensis]|uniref:Uncharacterized protein n=1 Tax=Acididesulfobacter guangdongensis TaxID=2597225 RepID=A0A519BFZ4_ACIG2|nr:MAG: hypothetical protein EVJ46_08300 [Candidatus Acididesulfobacter guangdongensis]
MKRIKVEEVSEGNVLAKSIVLDNGVVLLSKGSILTDLIINQIKKQHIFYVYIANNGSLTDEGADVSYLNGRTMENDLSDIEERFILVGNIKLMEDIKNIIKKVIIQEYQG